MVGEVGIESLDGLGGVEGVKVGGTRMTGMNVNFLKLLPKLRKLSFYGIQRRNGGACWSPLITDLDLDTIAMLSDLEELSLGVGLSLAKSGVPTGGGNNCRLAGGIKITDLGLAKLSKLKNLRVLDVSGAQITPAGLKVLQALPRLQRLQLWNSKTLDDSTPPALYA